MSSGRCPGPTPRNSPSARSPSRTSATWSPPKQALTEAVLWLLQHPDTFAPPRRRPARGVLALRATRMRQDVRGACASSGRLSVHAVKGAELMDKWVGSSEKAVRELFRRAGIQHHRWCSSTKSTRSPRRGQSFDSGVGDRVVAALLTELDGIELRDVVVLGATNRPELIDPPCCARDGGGGMVFRRATRRRGSLRISRPPPSRCR